MESIHVINAALRRISPPHSLNSQLKDVSLKRTSFGNLMSVRLRSMLPSVLKKFLIMSLKRIAKVPCHPNSMTSLRIPCGALVIISVTAHSGFINGFLKTVQHKPYSLPTGGT